jgi:alpha-maltose-1-phosphate synthase
MGRPNAAIMFEPDGYLIAGATLMGRQMAGNAFLRAAVAALQNEILYVYTPRRCSAEAFCKVAVDFDLQADVTWIQPDRLDLLSEVGTLYLPGPGLNDAARLRLRAGPNAYSLVGVTHTTASHRAMDAISGLVTAPVAPWDALICTSTAVARTVRLLLEAEIDYLKWRVGATSFTLPQLPIIPLGVHCSDFVFSDSERYAARQALHVNHDDVVVLFVGRLTFHAKAHPYPMYAALEAVAQHTAKGITLLQCGWFGNVHIENAFKDGAQRYCPSVRALFTDGKDVRARRAAWAAADIFISLSDNIQETFGLSPIEAMAAGLAVIVTDWNGYKDTVRDGVDGFRIETFMPGPGLGDDLARNYEAEVDDYNLYIGRACQVTCLDFEQLQERLINLIEDVDLRRRLGAMGRRRAQSFDWSVVFRRYQDLWGHLSEIRAHSKKHAGWPRLAPKAAPTRLDPFHCFAHYASHLIQPSTRAKWITSQIDYQDLFHHPLFSLAEQTLRDPKAIERMRQILAGGSVSLEELCSASGLSLRAGTFAVAVLAKMGSVRLDADETTLDAFRNPTGLR